jgi:hypothetical protein
MTQEAHHHRTPTVFIIDRAAKLRDFNGTTNEEMPAPDFKNAVYPIVLKLPPQPPHYVENIDTKPFHATRIEFKQGFPTGM